MKQCLILIFLLFSLNGLAQDSLSSVPQSTTEINELDFVFNANDLSFEQLVRDFGLVFMVICILILLIWGVNKVLTGLKLKFITILDRKILNPSGKNSGFINKIQAFALVRSGTSILRVIITILLVYISLPIIFSLLPWTEETTTALIDNVLYPVKIVMHSSINYIPNFLTILVIFFITRFIIRSIKLFTIAVASHKIKLNGFHSDWAFPTFNIIRALLYIFMFIVIFPYLPGSNSKVFQGVSVFLGVLLSFGSSSAISNIIAGIVLTYMRPFQIGDRVAIHEFLGDVTEKSLLVTRICTVKNEYVTIPNSIILNAHTINYTKSALEQSLILHTTVSIGYDADWKLVHKLLIDAAKKSRFVLKDKSPFVLQTSLDDFYLSYQLNAYVNDTNLPQIYSDLHMLIQDEFNNAGVEIMSPHYSSLRDGNNVAIPNEYVKEKHKSAGFKVEKS